MNSSPSHSAGRDRVTRKQMIGVGWLILGAVFLADPFIGLFDFLPDCLGFLFFSLGLRRIADLDDRLAEMLRATRRLSLLGIGRLLLLVFGYGLVSHSEQPVFILLALFTMGVLDILLLVPMWKHFNGGLLYLGSRLDATALFDRTGRGGRPHARSITERYATFSGLYFVLREVLAVLPEVTVLTHQAGGADGGAGGVLYEFVGLFRLIGEGASLVLGIVWLVMTVRYIRRLTADVPFMDRLADRYNTEILPRNDLFAMRAVKASMMALSAAALLSVDLYLEGVNILPDFLVAILLILSLLFLRRYVPLSRPAVIATAAFGVYSTVAWIYSLVFFTTEDLGTIDVFEDVHDRWQIAGILQALSAVAFVISVILTLRAILGLAKRYTGVAALHEGSTYAAERTSAIHLHLKRKMIAVAVLAGLSALSTVVFWVVVPQMPDMIPMGQPSAAETLGIMAYDLIREAYWFIDILIGLVFFGVTVHATGEVSEQMEYSHMMR